MTSVLRAAHVPLTCAGGHALVPGSRDPPGLQQLLHPGRPVVCGLHLLGAGHAAAALPRGLRDRPAVQDLQVRTSETGVALPSGVVQARVPCLCIWSPEAYEGMGCPDRRAAPVPVMACRLLGTPNEERWPGVSQLPDFSTSFPQWSPKVGIKGAHPLAGSCHP